MGIAHAEDAPGAPTSEDARRGTVLASYKGGQITIGQVEDILAMKLPQQRAEIAKDPAQFLKDLTTYELLYLEAERRGYGNHMMVTEAKERKAIERLIAERFPLTPEAVDKKDVERAYQEHISRYVRKPTRRASQIVVKTEAEARALLRTLKPRDRTGFAQLASARSIDEQSKAHGGDLGQSFDDEGRAAPGGEVIIAPAIAKAVFALKHVGDISQRPLRVDGGFSVLMCSDETPGFSNALPQVEDELRTEIVVARQEQGLKEWVAQLTRENNVEVHPELVEPIVLEPAAPLDIPSGFPAAPSDPAAPPVLVKPDKI